MPYPLLPPLLPSKTTVWPCVDEADKNHADIDVLATALVGSLAETELFATPNRVTYCGISLVVHVGPTAETKMLLPGPFGLSIWQLPGLAFGENV